MTGAGKTNHSEKQNYLSRDKRRTRLARDISTMAFVSHSRRRQNAPPQFALSVAYPCLLQPGHHGWKACGKREQRDARQSFSIPPPILSGTRAVARTGRQHNGTDGVPIAVLGIDTGRLSSDQRWEVPFICPRTKRLRNTTWHVGASCGEWHVTNITAHAPNPFFAFSLPSMYGSKYHNTPFDLSQLSDHLLAIHMRNLPRSRCTRQRLLSDLTWRPLVGTRCCSEMR
ncbi:unnamed protein product [Trypanosoma congolense IL3000]|uniref:WGS project CAEQ00000000 data, annotated contig 1048 n=1 Tax=Trypanosoma congolense (strain IL3000) TaxID=1068625 RepID=F9W3F8_TRYCI|nr:unnamed protein product [Trypanosoma congolense IL3000]